MVEALERPQEQLPNKQKTVEKNVKGTLSKERNVTLIPAQVSKKYVDETNFSSKPKTSHDQNFILTI